MEDREFMAAQYTVTVVDDILVVTNVTNGGTIVLNREGAIVKLEELLEQLRK